MKIRKFSKLQLQKAHHQEQSSWMHPTPRKFAYSHGERRSCMLHSQSEKELK